MTDQRVCPGVPRGSRLLRPLEKVMGTSGTAACALQAQRTSETRPVSAIWHTTASRLRVRHSWVLPLVGLLGTYMIILAGEPQHVVLIGDGFVARRIVWSLAGRQAAHGIVVRRIKEKGNGVPITMGIAVDDAVRGREKTVIGPASQHIARVD